MTRRRGGTNAPRHRMRCSEGKQGCGARFTLRRHPDKYVRPVKCPYCKSTVVRSVEADRRRQQDRENTCYCSAYPFPHRAASLRMCREHPQADQEPSDEEKDAYYGCLETPRSGFC